MSLTKDAKAQMIEKFGGNAKNTGSTEAQIAMLTERLSYLNTHFKAHKKDFHSRQGLMQLVGRRRSLLDYLQRKSESRYKALIAELGIRK
jgi:small subunit ribosomal protein S15